MKYLFRYLVPLALVFALAYLGQGAPGLAPTSGATPATATQPSAPAADEAAALLARAFREQQSDLQVEGEGRVKKVLPDDRDGRPHQRFILELSNGQTVLVAHNLELGERLAKLAVGERIAFAGEYEWNARGGVIHWTHADPRGQHPPGWLRRLDPR